MAKHLVLVGGGHAHLGVLKQLGRFTRRGHRVTLVSPSPFHDYSGMGPGLITGRYRLVECRFNIARMATIRGGRFIECAATGIDPDAQSLKLADGRELGYDVVSFNTGSSVAFPIPKPLLGKNVFPVKPVENLFIAGRKILESARATDTPLRLLVVGGGPAGCEVAGNLQQLVSDAKIDAVVQLVTGGALLAAFPERTGASARSLLARKELHLYEGTRVVSLQQGMAHLDDGRRLAFDFAFVASGIAPDGPFSGTPLAAVSGGLAVNASLQSPVHPNVFGGGDCISFQPRHLDKVGVHAVRQNPVLRHNLLAALENTPLQSYQPQRRYLLIFNLGLRRALATGYGLNWSGRTALFLKDILDRRFLEKYREIG